MGHLRVSDEMWIQSRTGRYSVIFDEVVPLNLLDGLESEPHFLVDANVAKLYASRLKSVLAHRNTVVIDATEQNKSLQGTVPIFERLVLNNVRRDHTLIAIGGGVVQDITCFIASTLLRGVAWRFVPTTLLAQADSCIGSKSSINLGKAKNILGTFNPPRTVLIYTEFLGSLDMKEIRSGVGEIIKVHAISGAAAFDGLAADFGRIFDDSSLLLRYIRSALLIKKPYIEEDEYDRGIRNIFNYGHSFGHAIESATNYGVPHGIAVTMGMQMANFIAVMRGLLPTAHYERMRPILRMNYGSYVEVAIPIDALLAALLKDKKNTSTALRLIFPIGSNAAIQSELVSPDSVFRAQCVHALRELPA
jgi:3-dehydroquinate synthase